MVRRRKIHDQFQMDYTRGLMLPNKKLFLPRSMNVHNPGCCGCGSGPSCVLFTDDWTRADSTSIGAAWTEFLGNWSIVSNTLRVASALTPAVLISASGLSQAECTISWWFTDWDTGTYIRALFDYVDSSNHYFAELEFDSGSSGHIIRLYQRSGGTDTLLASSGRQTGTIGNLSLCYNGTSLTAYCSQYPANLSVSYVIPALSTSTPVFGMEVENPVTTSDIRFGGLGPLEVRKVDPTCEHCNPGNCCAQMTTGPTPRPYVCIFDDFGPPLSMQVDIEGAYDSDPGDPDGSNDDCDWCGSEPSNISCIATNSAMYAHDCVQLPITSYFTPNQCVLHYEEAFPELECSPGSDPETPRDGLCKVYVRVGFQWATIGTTYRIVVTHEAAMTYDPGTYFSCEDAPCGNPFQFNIGTWIQDYAWPVGGVHAADLVSLSIPLSGLFPLDVCSFTDESCVISFLT
jgi:hypothetical protein